ncbi:MAG: SpoIIE family protein phosphatase [Acidobacteria bacterium]|nr:SpoIIE family protein phosphatase [Acidobacteriota bacterium]
MAIRSEHTGTLAATGRVLIADDQMHVLEALRMLLSTSGWTTETVTHPGGVLRALETGEFDAVLMDLNYARDTTGGGEGLELLSQIRSIDSVLPVLVMTAWSSVDVAVDAMRRGASDFIQKPWENDELLQKLHTQLAAACRQREIRSRRDWELREARAIQESLLPRILPELAGFEIAAVSRPLLAVGGDYYSVVRINQRYTAVSIADVAGKGLPAALLMSSLHAALKPLISPDLAPAKLCHRLNQIMCDLTPLGKFISFFHAVLDDRDNRLVYCNAGHNPPVLIRADGTSAELTTAGAVLGHFPDWLYEEGELQMRGGDKLLLFTDGLVEASNGDAQAFGEQNLIHIATENRNSSASELMALLMRAASQYSGEHFQDDASLIVLKATADQAYSEARVH